MKERVSEPSFYLFVLKSAFKGREGVESLRVGVCEFGRCFCLVVNVRKYSPFIPHLYASCPKHSCLLLHT